jgi:hypothetical protein
MGDGPDAAARGMQILEKTCIHYWLGHVDALPSRLQRLSPTERGLLLMRRIPVSSAGITQVGYHEDSETLEIEFSKGGLYQFFNVPTLIYDSLMSATSKDDYYHTCIGSRFPCSRIR